MVDSANTDEVLKPFYERASEAEERLARLEAAVATTKDGGNEELLKTISELQYKLEQTKAEQLSERDKASLEIQKLTTENALLQLKKEKLEYRITHLVRALKEADDK